MVKTGTYKQNTDLFQCFGTIEHFLARMDMKIRPVRSGINFLPDFIGFKRLKIYMSKQKKSSQKKNKIMRI